MALHILFDTLKMTMLLLRRQFAISSLKDTNRYARAVAPFILIILQLEPEGSNLKWSQLNRNPTTLKGNLL